MEAKRRRDMMKVVCSFVLGAASAAAQVYVLRDGSSLSDQQAEIRGAYLIETLFEDGEAGRVEKAHPVEEVAKLDWPKPDVLTRVGSPGSSSADEQLAAFDAEIARFAPFPRTPGSWWAALVLAKTELLLQLGQDGRAAEQLQALVVAEVTGAPAQSVRLLFVELDLRQGRTELASAMLDHANAELGADSAALAQVSCLRGEIALRRSRFDEALEAFLRVRAFYPREQRYEPRALLGAAVAYRGLGEIGRAQRTLQQLLRRYPNGSWAEQAQRDLQASSS